MILEFKNWIDIRGAFEILKNEWHNFINLALDQIRYADMAFAIRIAIIVTAFAVIKLLFVAFGRKENVWMDSGYLISSRPRNRKGFLTRMISVLPRVFISIPLAAVMLAIADPFLVDLREEVKYIETRIRVEAKDISGSMDEVVGDASLKAQMAMESQLEFLKMRRGKGDRTSLWVFSDGSYMMQDFIVDDDAYYLQVFDAPWVASSGSDRIPPWRRLNLSGEGGTEIAPLLIAVTNQFDRDEELQKKSPRYRPIKGRSLLIITDAEVSDSQSAGDLIGGLMNRKIVIYIILISRSGEVSDSAKPLLDEIVKNGGGYFSVSASDRSAIRQAYVKIDQMEKSTIGVSRQSFKLPLFDKFIFLAIFSLVVLIPAGLVIESILADYP